MRDQPLLPASVEAANAAQRTIFRQRPLPRLRGGNDPQVFAAIGSGCCCTFVLLCAFCVTAVTPLEWGIKKSGLTGMVTGEPVSGGLHFVFPWQSYMRWPRTRVTLEFSGSYVADRRAIASRTGPGDANDPDSGGQPLSISCAVQIRMRPEMLRQAFLTFGGYTVAKDRYILLAGNMVSNTAQEFTPQDFWTRRHRIAARMQVQINSTLYPLGAEAMAFEIMKVDFAAIFENALTGVQVAEQLSVYNQYAKQVMEVEQSINVLNAANGAEIAKIKAKADKVAKETVGIATKDAFVNKQTAKSVMFAQLQKQLEFNDDEMAEYVKIRSIMSQSSQNQVFVDVEPPFVDDFDY